MAHQELMLAWLNDAYAMENSLIRTLEHRVKEARDHPHILPRVEQHLAETRRHAEMLKGCIERLGSGPSALKTGMANVMGTVQSMSTGVAKDELVKNCLTDYAAEQFEVASYAALIAGTERLGDQGTAMVCRQISQEDAAMAAWLAEHTPMVVREVVQQGMAAHTR